jgi:hypothetical protein
MARLACGARLVRPRAPLVLRRGRLEHRQPAAGTVSPRVEHHTALHLHVMWPQSPAPPKPSTVARPTSAAIVSRVQVANLSLHQHLQRQALNQNVIVNRPVLISTWNAAAPASTPRQRIDRSRGRVMRHALQPSTPPSGGAGAVHERSARRRFRQRASPSDGTVPSQAPPRVVRVVRGDIRLHAVRPNPAPARTARARASAERLPQATRAPRQRATPIALVRPLRSRVGGAPRRTGAGPSVASSLRQVERVITHTKVMTHATPSTATHDAPAARVLHRPIEEPRQPAAQTSVDRPAAVAAARPPTPPVIDVARLSDEVYRHIQRRVRIERERRGA